MGCGSKCSIWNGQVIYIEKSKLNIADMWLIALDCVTNLIENYEIGLCTFALVPYSVKNLHLAVSLIWSQFKKLTNMIQKL